MVTSSVDTRSVLTAAFPLVDSSTGSTLGTAVLVPATGRAVAEVVGAAVAVVLAAVVFAMFAAAEV